MVRVIIGSVIALFGLFMGLGMLSFDPVDKGGVIASAVVIALGGILVFRGLGARKNNRPGKDPADTMERIYKMVHIPPDQLNAFLAGQIPFATQTPILLSDGESAHYYCDAVMTETKNKVVGTTGGGAGISVRVAKGVRVRTGSGSSKRVYRDVTDSYNGHAVITSDRFVFLHSQKGFECKLKDITAIAHVNSSTFNMQVKSKSYQLSMPLSDKVPGLIQALRT